MMAFPSNYWKPRKSQGAWREVEALMGDRDHWGSGPDRDLLRHADTVVSTACGRRIIDARVWWNRKEMVDCPACLASPEYRGLSEGRRRRPIPARARRAPPPLVEVGRARAPQLPANGRDLVGAVDPVSGELIR